MTVSVFAPKPGASVLYKPSPKAPQGPLGTLVVNDSARPMKAIVVRAHTPRLVDLSVEDHEGLVQVIRFVPLLHDGDPDPNSPLGSCQLGEHRLIPVETPRETQSIAPADVQDVDDLFLSNPDGQRPRQA